MLCNLKIILLSVKHREHYDNHLKSQWLNFVKSILCDLGFSHVWENQCTFNSYSLLLCIKNKLKEKYQNFWALRMKSDDKMSKLRTYKLIKKTFGIEKYLELNERKHRKALWVIFKKMK